MARKILNDEERQLRKRKNTQKLFQSYKTYSDGPMGSKEQWQHVAAVMLSESGKQSHLDALGLSKMPDTLEQLNKARNKAMMSAHPDKGGLNEHAVLINEAYDKIRIRFARPATGKFFEDQGDAIEPAKADHIDHIDYENLWVDARYINEDHISEKKLDGSRYMLYLDETCKLLSKRISTVTGKYVDKTLNCPHLTRVVIPKEFWGTVIDGEMVHPLIEKSDATTSIMGCSPEEAVERQKANGWLQFCVYDLPKVQGEDIRSEALRERKIKLSKLIKELKKYIPVKISQTYPSSKAKELYNGIISAGGEGIMLKDLNAPYGSGLFKVKKVVTWDVVIIGYQEPKKNSKKRDGSVSVTSLHQRGLIGSVVFGAYRNGQLIELGTCSGMSESIRVELSKNGRSYIGKVIEIRFQERTKSGAFRHGRFVRFREDKAAIQCIDTEFEIKG